MVKQLGFISFTLVMIKIILCEGTVTVKSRSASVVYNTTLKIVDILKRHNNNVHCMLRSSGLKVHGLHLQVQNAFGFFCSKT